MRRKTLGGCVLVATVAMLASACGGGSAAEGGGGGGGGQGNTVTVGLLTSTTGSSAAGFVGVTKAAKARIKKANAENELGDTKLKLVVGDDTSTPAGSLKAAKDLVENKNVSAVLAWSAFTYGAYRYLHSKDIPVIGGSFDGPEWAGQDNMFAVDGSADPTYPAPTTWGKILKSQGVTRMALLGYGSSPSATATVKNWKASAKAAGIKVPYVNLSIPFGSTDFGSAALGIKNARADGLYAAMVPNSNYALLTAAKQQGSEFKAAIFPTGYGQALLDNATAVKSAEGVDFYTIFKPVEVNDSATKQWQADLKKYAGYTGVPSFGIEGGWLAADALVAGLQKVKGDITSDSITKAMNHLTDYTADGLYPHPRDFSKRSITGVGMGPGNCIYVSQVRDGKFVPLHDGKPYCGKLIPNSAANPGGK